MRNRALVGVVALLAVACVVEAGYILVHRANASAPERDVSARGAQQDLDRWETRVRKQIERSGRLGDEDFDRIFGDDFFRRRFDPFAEIDRVRRRIEEGLEGSGRAAFGDSFQSWFSKRMDLAGIRTSVADEGRDVAVSFGIPGLDTNSVKFDVNANRIRFRYDTRRDVKKNGADVETAESVEKVLPLPAGADPNGFEVRKGKDEVTLVFHKLAHAS